MIQRSVLPSVGTPALSVPSSEPSSLNLNMTTVCLQAAAAPGMAQHSLQLKAAHLWNRWSPEQRTTPPAARPQKALLFPVA